MDYAIDAPGNYGGDAEERRVWPELKSLFPHYETLWQNVIVRLTERPASMSLRTDLSDEWMRFAEDHYSIFLHLAVANNRAKRCYEELLAFEEVFAHLGSMLDLVEDFFFITASILKGAPPAPPSEVQTREALAQHLAKWAETKAADKYRDKVSQSGRSYPVHLLNPPQKSVFLRAAPQHDTLWDEFIQIRDEVRRPRNVFIHRALTAKLLLHGDNRILAPKNPENYLTWKSVAAIADQPEVLKRDFSEVDKLANTTITRAATMINKLSEALWEDSGTQLVQKLPTRSNRYGALKPIISELGSFTSTTPASGVAVTTSASLTKIWNDGHK